MPQVSAFTMMARNLAIMAASQVVEDLRCPLAVMACMVMALFPTIDFEKLYYEKHPELLKKECGQYGGALGDGRGEWALSSDDLNKIVRETASRGAGLGKYGLTDIFNVC